MISVKRFAKFRFVGPVIVSQMDRPI